MNRVVDASALAATLVDLGHESRWARAEIADVPLAAPEFALAETTNILRRFELYGRITPAEGAAAFRELLMYKMDLYPFAPYAARIWELRANVTAYDAWYVALAESLGCPLVTLDRRLSRASGPTCEIIMPPLSADA